MLAILRLPPLVTLVLSLAILAFLIYHVATIGTFQPLDIVLLAVAIFSIIRSLLRMRRKPQADEDD